MPEKTVIIDCFPDSIQHYRQGYAVVAVDVFRATTTAATAVALGRRCFSVSSETSALALAAQLENPLLMGELGGCMPAGFDMNNSPSELAQRTDLARPVIMLSPSGSKLIERAGECEAGYTACFRDFGSVTNHLVRHPRVAVIGAGSRGEFSEEDQMCCAWIGARLLEAGYVPENQETAETIDRWRGVPASACADGHSALHLTRSGQLEDLEFVLQHINDLELVCMVRNGEVLAAPAASVVAEEVIAPPAGLGLPA